MAGNKEPNGPAAIALSFGIAKVEQATEVCEYLSNDYLTLEVILQYYSADKQFKEWLDVKVQVLL